LFFATAQSMRDAMVSSVVIAMVDKFSSVDEAQLAMPMSIAQQRRSVVQAIHASVFLRA
jgi:hypothetical protein